MQTSSPSVRPGTERAAERPAQLTGDRRLPPPGAGIQWWEHSHRQYDPEGHLVFAGRRVSELVARVETPAYFYAAERIIANVERLRQHLATLASPFRLLYAMKANRFAPVLGLMRDLHLGLDVCSPGEVRHALDCGFGPVDLSFTAGSLSTADYAALGGWPDVWVNVDSLTAIRRLAEVSPGRTIGLRINPAVGLGYRTNALVRYSGDRPTKFGVYRDRFAEALELAANRGLQVLGLHCHAGCGFLTPQLPALEEVFAAIRAFAELAPGIKRLNLGGGLGIPLAADDNPLDLAAWCDLVRRYFDGRGLLLEFEPGDYLVKDAGVLVTEVTQVEEKRGHLFVGVNAGFNVHVEPAFYQLPLVPAPALRRPGEPQAITLAGNINEALDVWAENVSLPPLAEGDTLCLLNAGGYGASMASAHCLRAEFTEHLLAPHTADADLDAELAQSLSVANRRAWDDLYASTGELVWGAAAAPFLAEFVEKIARTLPPRSRVLDAGTGEGRNLPLLLRSGAAEVHAVDASPHALAKIPAACRERVICRRASLDATGYPDATFDAIVAIDVLETLPDLGRVLVELARILKPGGFLVCNIPGHDDGVAGDDMHELGENAYLYRGTYYFHFLEPGAAERHLTEAGFLLARSARCEWRESAHPGFRAQEHAHVSQVYVAQRPPAISPPN